MLPLSKHLLQAPSWNDQGVAMRSLQFWSALCITECFPSCFAWRLAAHTPSSSAIDCCTVSALLLTYSEVIGLGFKPPGALLQVT